MKQLILIVLLSIGFYACTKTCGECFVVEFETDGVTVKNETPMGEYCGNDSKVKAGEDASAQGITCNNCHIECR